MLTSTYTLVALSVEQSRARVEVQALLERWRPSAWWGEPPALRQYEQACDGLRRVVDACHWRKLDKFVLPALRRRGAGNSAGNSTATEALLAELDALSRRAAEARAAAQSAAVKGDPGCLAAIERCCQLLLERLDLEERKLLPLARSVIPGEAWFAIANQMLAHDNYQNEHRGTPPAPDANGPPARGGGFARQNNVLSLVN